MEANGVNIVFPSSATVCVDSMRYPTMIPILKARPISYTDPAGELR